MVMSEFEVISKYSKCKTSLLLYNIEEMTLENSKFVTNMQSNINEATIESIYA